MQSICWSFQEEVDVCHTITSSELVFGSLYAKSSWFVITCLRRDRAQIGTSLTWDWRHSAFMRSILYSLPLNRLIWRIEGGQCIPVNFNVNDIHSPWWRRWISGSRAVFSLCRHDRWSKTKPTDEGLPHSGWRWWASCPACFWPGTSSAPPLLKTAVEMGRITDTFLGFGKDQLMRLRKMSAE